jgi:hypothetical protein
MRCDVSFRGQSRRRGLSGACRPREQDAFIAAFGKDLNRLRLWARPRVAYGRISGVASLRIRRVQNLEGPHIPAAIGQRGRIEFPAWKIVAGEDIAIAHELLHVFSPNGNRLLAEGLRLPSPREPWRKSGVPEFRPAAAMKAIEGRCGMVPEFQAAIPIVLIRSILAR